MDRTRASLLILTLAVALSLSTVPAFAQSASPITVQIGLEGITLTDFGSFFPLPVGVRIGADVRVAELAPGLSVSVEGSAGWWMESFRDTIHFRPAFVPFKIPVSSAVGLMWEPTGSLMLGVSAQLGFVLEWAPGAPPTILLYLSPGWMPGSSSPVAPAWRHDWVGPGSAPIRSGMARR